MKIKMLLFVILMPCMMQAEYFDHFVIEKHKKENLALFASRFYKQLGYSAVIGTTAVGAGLSLLNFDVNMNYVAEKYKDIWAMLLRLSALEKKINGVTNSSADGAQPGPAIQPAQKTSSYGSAIVSLGSALTWNVTVALTSALIVGFAKSVASRNGVLKDVYSDMVAAYTKPDVNWYIEHYAPLYEHLDSFKYCAVYFDMHSPFLHDVHSNAITMQYIESLVQASQEARSVGYVQFLQRKAETSVGNAQALLKYDECLSAARYRKKHGQCIEEDNSLIQQMREHHIKIVEDLEKILGFIYAIKEYHNVKISESEKEFLSSVMKRMRLYAEHIAVLLDGTESEREQASLQGKGLFTQAHEFELYLKTIFRS